MVRTQIQLTEQQHRQLRRLANRLGISLSEAVRRCVADRLAAEKVDVGREDLVREALAVAGKYVDRNGTSRVATDHDDHLAEAYGR
jgi:hypothetical protein